MTQVTKDTEFASIFNAAVEAVDVVNRNRYHKQTGEEWPFDTVLVTPEHYWWSRIMRHFNLHPVVGNIINMGVRPVDWHLLLLEWPHVSVEDETQIAYTRNEKNGQDFIENGSRLQTKTSIGKYLARHWPHVPDHTRRDWAGAFSTNRFEIWDTMEGIISGIELGPQSCMKSSYGSIPFRDRDNEALVMWQRDKNVHVKWDYHPYAVYDPKYGWRMAVRIDPGKPDVVMGRALVYEPEKMFVRSYRRGDHESDYSHTDEKLEHWLEQKGYNKHTQWPDGAKLRKVPHPTRGNAPFMLPYIDGDQNLVDDCGGYLRMDDCGSYSGENTNGEPGGGRESVGSCEDCGATVYEDDEDRIWVGRHEDICIGGECGCRDNYSWVTGRSGRGYGINYYVHNDDVVTVDGEDYDEDNLPDNIVQLNDGEFVDRENTPVVEINGDYYREDDNDVCECTDGEWRLQDDCWEDINGDWHSNEETQIDVSGGSYTAEMLQEIINNA